MKRMYGKPLLPYRLHKHYTSFLILIPLSNLKYRCRGPASTIFHTPTFSLQPPPTPPDCRSLCRHWRRYTSSRSSGSQRHLRWLWMTPLARSPWPMVSGILSCPRQMDSQRNFHVTSVSEIGQGRTWKRHTFHRAALGGNVGVFVILQVLLRGRFDGPPLRWRWLLHESHGISGVKKRHVHWNMWWPTIRFWGPEFGNCSTAQSKSSKIIPSYSWLNIENKNCMFSALKGNLPQTNNWWPPSHRSPPWQLDLASCCRWPVHSHPQHSTAHCCCPSRSSCNDGSPWPKPNKNLQKPTKHIKIPQSAWTRVFFCIVFPLWKQTS